MRIEGPAPTFPGRERQPRKPEAETAAKAAAEPVRGVPAVVRGDEPTPRPRGTFAPLAAQLLAARLDMPQARMRRRAEPHEAVAAYGERAPMPAPARFSRAV